MAFDGYVYFLSLSLWIDQIHLRSGPIKKKLKLCFAIKWNRQRAIEWLQKIQPPMASARDLAKLSQGSKTSIHRPDLKALWVDPFKQKKSSSAPKAFKGIVYSQDFTNIIGPIRPLESTKSENAHFIYTHNHTSIIRRRPIHRNYRYDLGNSISSM